MRLFVVCVFGCRFVIKFFLKGFGKVLSFGWIGSSVGVDARVIFRFGMMDFSRF